MSNRTSVLITGACGFLGKSVMRLFLDSDYHVIALDLPSSQQLIPAELAENSSLDFIAADLNDKNLEKILPSQIDYVIHLAGLASVKESIENPVDYETVNVQGTVNLLNACKNLSLSKFVFSSSASVYGSCSSIDLEETDSLNPLSPYAKSKALAETHVRDLGREFGFSVLILRFFNIYGPGQNLNDQGIVNTFIKSILTENRIEIHGKESRTRSLIHVHDCARAILLSCETNTPSEAVINVCDSHSASVREVANILIECSRNSEIRLDYIEPDFPLVHASGCTGRLALDLLGFSTEISLEDGLRETFQYYSKE